MNDGLGDHDVEDYDQNDLHGEGARLTKSKQTAEEKLKETFVSEYMSNQNVQAGNSYIPIDVVMSIYNTGAVIYKHNPYLLAIGCLCLRYNIGNIQNIVINNAELQSHLVRAKTPAVKLDIIRYVELSKQLLSEN